MTYGQLGRDGSGNSLDLLSVLVQDESRHSFDLLFLCDLLVDVSMVHYPGPNCSNSTHAQAQACMKGTREFGNEYEC